MLPSMLILSTRKVRKNDTFVLLTTTINKIVFIKFIHSYYVVKCFVTRAHCVIVQGV